jgi:UDP-N-acetylglucosamine 4,6-dehydratase/5-epimerase
MNTDYLNDKSILITGGTGSFGKAFINTLLENSRARRIIIFSRDELKQSVMAATIPDPEQRLRFFIGDVRDADRLKRAFNGVDYIVHAAALKQVPVLEYNPFEAVKTNILGTQNVINAALDRKVEKVMFISTDKAANPANLYGATKLCAEKLVISGNAYSGEGGTRFSAVRYGNVFGSRGSLLNIIERQRESGKITLTHEEMTRFWITLEQGVELVLRGLSDMHGGEIFIPKVPSMKVSDFIRALAPECEFEIIGIRPGEKMHELLVTPEEARHTEEHEHYYLVNPEFDWWNKHNHQGGKEVGNDFVLSSLKNERWLTGEDLKGLLENL